MKTTILFIAISIGILLNSDAQSTKKWEGEISKLVQTMPRFPGCENLKSNDKKDACSKEKLMNYINAHLQYQEGCKAGRVIISFVVNPYGGICNAIIQRDESDGCGESAMAVIEKMHLDGVVWVPGTSAGKNVAVLYTIPITFGQPEDPKSPLGKRRKKN
ncbi:MAG: hypothetical protein WAU01_01705 [Saprospiraceae bacterium]